MSVQEHAEEFAGLPVRDYDPDAGIEDAEGSAQRISLSYEDMEEDGVKFVDRLSRFLEDPNAGAVQALVVGPWQGEDTSTDSESIVEALVAARDVLKGLRGLFLGDVTGEECEISWIEQSDVTPLFDAYPKLEHFRVRGGNHLTIGTLRHANLLSLAVETGGLDAGVVRGIASSDLPALETLELWIGTDGYGRTTSIEDLAPILAGDRFPALRRLGLRNCEGADELAKAVAASPILAKIEVLDLSMGDLGDEGALALAENPDAPGLTLLDIHHHYVSDQAIEQLKARGITLDATDRREPDDWGGEEHRYIAVSE